MWCYSTFINILYFIIALVAASIPTALDWYKNKKKPHYFNGYISCICLLIIIGLTKVLLDSDSQNKQAKTIDNLNMNVCDLKILVKSKQARYDSLIRDLNRAGIKITNNKPTTITNNMRDVGTINQ